MANPVGPLDPNFRDRALQNMTSAFTRDLAQGTVGRKVERDQEVLPDQERLRQLEKQADGVQLSLQANEATKQEQEAEARAAGDNQAEIQRGRVRTGADEEKVNQRRREDALVESRTHDVTVANQGVQQQTELEQAAAAIRHHHELLKGRVRTADDEKRSEELAREEALKQLKAQPTVTPASGDTSSVGKELKVHELPDHEHIRGLRKGMWDGLPVPLQVWEGAERIVLDRVSGSVAKPDLSNMRHSKEPGLLAITPEAPFPFMEIHDSGNRPMIQEAEHAAAS